MSVINYKYRYIPSKPVTYTDMGNTRWVYVEAPPSKADMMGGCPTSIYEFGVIATEKMVLESAREKIGLTLHTGEIYGVRHIRENHPKMEEEADVIRLHPEAEGQAG